MTDDERTARLRASQKRYRERHREKIRTYSLAYLARHRKSPVPTSQSKQCRNCGIQKTKDQFYRIGRSKGKSNRGGHGVEAVCKACKSSLRKPSLTTERAEKAALAASGQKRCGTCHQIKPLDQFHIRRASNDGLAYSCEPCVTNRSTAWRKAHPKAFAEWREQNKDYSRQRFKEWRSKNAERLRQSYKSWARNNRGLVTANDRRRQLAKMRATPAWADKAAIRAIYIEAARLTRETGVRHDVDHIVPIRNRTVCGLHVACNLQILTRSENQRKGNHHEAFLSKPASIDLRRTASANFALAATGLSAGFGSC